MGKALLIASNPAALNIGSARYSSIANAQRSTQTIEAVANIPIGVAGTLSKLATLADNVGTSRTLQLRKNSANGSQSLAPADTTAGLYADTSHTDLLAAGDVFSVRTTSTGLPTYYWVRLIFQATGNHATVFAGLGSVSSNGTRFFPLGGFGNGATIETNLKTKLRAAGSMSYMSVYIGSNAATAAGTVTSRKNSAPGNMSITIGAGLTGNFLDTTNSDTVASGDDYAFRFVYGTGGNSQLSTYGCSFTTTTGATNEVIAAGGATRSASGTPTYYCIAGDVTAQASEANAKIQHGFAVSSSNLRTWVSANTYTGSATLTLRNNGAPANQTFAIGAGLTGLFEDSANIDFFGPADDIAVEVVGGTSGSISFTWLALTETDVSLQSGVGSSAGAGSASGVGAAIGAGVGSSAGTGSASGVGRSTAAAVGMASGVGAATGVGRSTAAAVAVAAGAGAAAGVGGAIAAAVGAASGAGAASGVATAIAAAVGIAAGIGTAIAVGLALTAPPVVAARTFIGPLRNRIFRGPRRNRTFGG